ncbi:MAG: hypothetical protein QHH15_03615 [Candidatus Thermoplasmatota archaeon]|nr:hypothetical protein [Candidatus Thermoplasmatota archaeon]
MKICKRCIIFLSMGILIISSLAASAESIIDTTGDIYHWTETAGVWSWKQNINREDIDITEISSSVNGNKIIFTFKILGTIQTTEKIGYYFYYNTSDTNYWVIVYAGESVALAISQGTYAPGTVEINGNTITAEFEILGDTAPVEIWGWAVEWTEVGDMNHEWWGDWAPNTKFTGTISDNETGNEDTNGTDTGNVVPEEKDNEQAKKTPGFELISFIVALGIALILLKRRRK